MKIDLTFDEAHWVRYALLMAASDSNRALYLEVLNKLNDAERLALADALAEDKESDHNAVSIQILELWRALAPHAQTLLASQLLAITLGAERPDVLNSIDRILREESDRNG